MCIIASAAKKRYMKRAEVIESMRINSAGFFMCALKPDGTRKTIRTLDDKEALGFFDDQVKEEDAFVMHARIPSRGAKTIENVHGWEAYGILFMHNMTINDIDDMMRRAKWEGTDSEFFFRKIFVPYYLGLGKEAYVDGKFHPDLDNLIIHFVGHSNKFCFIMPDNRVIRYGLWVSEPDRKENGEIAFYASNSTYKVYDYKSAGKGGTAAGAAGFRNGTNGYGNDWSELYGCDEYGGYYDYEGYYHCGGKKHRGKKGGKQTTTVSPNTVPTTNEKKKDDKGKVLLKLAGVKGVCQLALTHLVLENTIDCREIYSEEKEEEKVQKVLRNLMPACYFNNYKEVKEAFKELAGIPVGITCDEVRNRVGEFAAKIAEIYEEKMYKEKSPYAVVPTDWTVKLGLESTIEKLNVLLRLNNVALDFGISDPQDFVKAYVMSKNGKELDEVFIDDIIGLDEMSPDAMLDAVQMILSFLTDTLEDFFLDGVVTEVPATSTASTTPTTTTETEPAKIGFQDPDAVATDAEEITLEDDNEIEAAASELADEATGFEVGNEEVDEEDTGLAGDDADTQDDDTPLGAA